MRQVKVRHGLARSRRPRVQNRSRKQTVPFDRGRIVLALAVRVVEIELETLRETPPQQYLKSVIVGRHQRTQRIQVRELRIEEGELPKLRAGTTEHVDVGQRSGVVWPVAGGRRVEIPVDDLSRAKTALRVSRENILPEWNLCDACHRRAREIEPRQSLGRCEVVHTRSGIDEIQRHRQVVIYQNLPAEAANVGRFEDQVAWQISRDREGDRLRVWSHESVVDAGSDCKPTSGGSRWKRRRKTAEAGGRKQQARWKICDA